MATRGHALTPTCRCPLPIAKIDPESPGIRRRTDPPDLEPRESEIAGEVHGSNLAIARRPSLTPRASLRPAGSGGSADQRRTRSPAGQPRLPGDRIGTREPIASSGRGPGGNHLLSMPVPLRSRYPSAHGEKPPAAIRVSLQLIRGHGSTRPRASSRHPDRATAWRLLTDLHRRLDANHGVTGSWLRFPVLSVRSWRTPWDWSSGGLIPAAFHWKFA